VPSSKPQKTQIVQAKFSIKKFNLSWLIITLLIFSVLFKLGLWQNERAVEKEQRLVRIGELKQQAAVSLPEVLSLSEQHSDGYLNDFPVIIDGIFNPEFVFLLDNQPNHNSLGYRVLQVVQSDKNAVLVNLGWVEGSVNRQELPNIKALSGHVKFQGNIRFVEKGIMLMEQKFDNNQWPLRIQQIELDKFSKLISTQLLPFVVYLDKKEELGFEKNWQPIVMPPEKHRAYAFQWFSLAIAWLTLMIWASVRAQKSQVQKKEKNNNNNKAENV